MKEDGSAAIVKIGPFDNSLEEGKKLKLKDNTKIVWGGYNNVVIIQNYITMSDHFKVFQ